MQSRTFASHTHAALDQFYGTEPYVFHLDEVKAVIDRFGYTQVSIANFDDFVTDTSYLHDIIEDTYETKQSLSERFHIYVADGVQNLSDVEALTRKERKVLTNLKFSKYSVDVPAELLALIVKPADRFANMSRSLLEGSSMMKVYFKEYPAFREAVYRENVVDELWLALDNLVEEYQAYFDAKTQAK